MEQELISIVVPVYRAERYIEETMDCVRAQTYPHWELLLVDDGSPDRSPEMCDAGGGLRPGPQQGDHRTIYSENRRYENPSADSLYESGGGEST